MPNKECSGCRGLNYILSQLILQLCLMWNIVYKYLTILQSKISNRGATFLGSLTKKKNEAW